MSRFIRNNRSSYRLIIRFMITGFITGLACAHAEAQAISELQKLWQDNKIAYFSDNKKDILFSSNDFHQYARMRDDAFGEYLKEPWHDYAIYSGLSEEPRKNLTKPPVFNYSGVDMTPPVNLPYSSVVRFNSNGTGQQKFIPRIRKPESDIMSVSKGNFLFYGQPISFNYDRLLEITKIKTVSEDSVSTFWSSFARSNSNHLVDQLMDYRDLLGLGDWGYFQLVKAASGQICKTDLWRSDLMTWALMIRSGFDVRIAFNQNSTTLLFPSGNTIYSHQFVVIDQKRFYLDREMDSPLLVTCQNSFPDNEGMIDLRFYKSLNFNTKFTTRKFLFTWNNKNFEFTLRSNPEIIRFYRNYPQTDAAVYFGAPFSSTLKNDLFAQLSPLLSKMNKAEATVFLQQFVQHEIYFTSVNQKELWANGRFAEEIIGSKTGDDRGKAVLFSWLVRVLLQLPVVGVHFPNYYSTGVSFNEPFEGDSYFWNHEKYCIADPTCINAPLGVMNPGLPFPTAQLIDLSGSYLQPYCAREVWNQAFRLGALRGGTSKDAVFDQRGRAFITGYFNDGQYYTPFIACFSPENSLQWIRKFEGDRRAIAFAITKVTDNEIYIAGSFNGKIIMDDATLQSETGKGELFLAQLNQNGELIWLKKAGNKATLQDKSLAYVVKFDRSGENISTQWSNEDERNIKPGFGGMNEKGLSFFGSESSTPGLIPFSWTVTKSDISGEIFKEYTLLMSNGCQPKIAGIVALLKLLQKPGAQVTGSQLRTLVNRYISSFPVDHTALFKTIGQIGQLKNDNGIISLRTTDNKTLIYNKIAIDNEARFKISLFNNGDLFIGSISGFQSIEKQMTWPLNSLLIDCSSGNVTLDYDYDHTLTTSSFATIFSTR